MDESVDREIEAHPWRTGLFSAGAWRRRALFVVAAVATGYVALFFNLADRLSVTFRAFLLKGESLWGFQMDPSVGTGIAAGLAIGGMWLIMTLRDRFFPGTQGTGIPQVMAALDVDAEDPLRRHMISWRIAVGKALLLMIGIFAGATIAALPPPRPLPDRLLLFLLPLFFFALVPLLFFPLPFAFFLAGPPSSQSSSLSSESLLFSCHSSL